jgi:hypothetical protein
MIHEHEGRSYPVVVCDHCHEWIADATDGNYEWRWQADTDFGSHIFFTHKRCCLAFERNRGLHLLAWPLECLPIYLGSNLALDWMAAHRTARRLGEID